MDQERLNELNEIAYQRCDMELTEVLRFIVELQEQAREVSQQMTDEIIRILNEHSAECVSGNDVYRAGLKVLGAVCPSVPDGPLVSKRLLEVTVRERNDARSERDALQRRLDETATEHARVCGELNAKIYALLTQCNEDHQKWQSICNDKVDRAQKAEARCSELEREIVSMRSTQAWGDNIAKEHHENTLRELADTKARLTAVRDFAERGARADNPAECGTTHPAHRSACRSLLVILNDALTETTEPAPQPEREWESDDNPLPAPQVYQKAFRDGYVLALSKVKSRWYELRSGMLVPRISESDMWCLIAELESGKTMLGAKKLRERINQARAEGRWYDVRSRWFGCEAIVVDGVSYPVKPGPDQGMYRLPAHPITVQRFARKLFARGAISEDALRAVLAAEKSSRAAGEAGEGKR